VTALRYAAAWLVCAFALALAGCASPYVATASALVAAERVVQGAAEQWPVFSDAKRRAIVAQATSLDDGRAQLDAWDATADKVTAAIKGAHATVKLGADGLQGVRDGLRDPKDLRRWITPAIRVGADLIELLSAFGLRLQGVL
jgi:short subunit dehydrogenase-like uncharacterized protein